MASYNGNDVYLSLDGTDVSAYYTDELNYQGSNATQETTAGSGQDFVQRGEGLTDTQLDFVLVYDAAFVGTLLPLIKPGKTVTVDYGPKTSDTGNPRHTGSFVVSSASKPININKQLVKFNVTLQQADTPTNNMFDGDTW